MDSKDSYCRLCAECMPLNKQVNLEEDYNARNEIMDKLARVNAAIILDEYKMPKTVCFECIDLLNKAHEFVVSINTAQDSLSCIMEYQFEPRQFFKKEDVSGDDEIAYEESGNVVISVKKESEIIENSDPVEHKTETKRATKKRVNNISDIENGPKTKTTSKNKVDVDSIPLSQLRVTWDNYSWYCTICECIFTSIDELQRHSIEVHKLCNPYRCTDCKIRKMRLDRFLIHVQKHHNYLRYSCFKCFKHFKTKLEARKHKASHLTTNFVCPGCHNCFTNDEDLQKHIEEFCLLKRVNKYPMKPQVDGLTCTICQKTFKSKGSLNTHHVMHTDRKNNYTCDICGRSFFMKHNLVAHMPIHTEERPHKCSLCTSSFKTARLLKDHIGVHSKDKPFTCSECGRSFRLRKQLESHSIVHTDNHPYSCQLCQKRFRFRNLLNNHVRLHTGVRPYSCEPCERQFTNWSNYNKHMKRKHNTDMSKRKNHYEAKLSL